MKIAIAGGGAIGRFIAEDLAQGDHEILIIEHDVDTIERNPLPGRVTWAHADACEISKIEALGLNSYDVFVAATGDDQVNLVASLLARQEFAIPRVIARVNHPKNAWLFNESWGIDQAVSVPHLITGMVEEAVATGHLVRLLQLVGGKASLIEITLAPASPSLGKQVSELDLPRSANLVAIVRDGTLVIPRGDTVMHVGDEVLAVTTPDVEDAMRTIFI
jgi:trk system potassium uptake protein TrkA